jgi:hypothetical protein
MLDVFRANPGGVDSVYLVQNHSKLFHKWGSRCGDTLRPLGYDIPNPAEHLYDWVYRWTLKNPNFMCEDEKKARGMGVTPPPVVKPFVDKTGNMNFNFNQAL